MSLADELLADFDNEEDAEDSIEKDLIPTQSNKVVESDPQPSHSAADEMDIDVPAVDHLTSSTITKLNDSPELRTLMEKIRNRLPGSSSFNELKSKAQITGPIESHPEYMLIVEANHMSVAIENEIQLLHKFVKEKYSKRFPELDSLVPDALHYMSTARELGNQLSRAKNNEKLTKFLLPATLMVVTVTAATTSGQVLTEAELTSVLTACDIALELNEKKEKILDFVESQMSFIAPNLSAVVGANIAAKLMGLAGGLTALSKMPACNVEVLGSSRRNLAGFSSKTSLPHTGFIFHCDIVQSTPADLRRKATRLVGAKCTICSRVDAAHASPDGSVGRELRDKIEKALDKLQEPPPVKQVKPLPAPIDQAGKKRGGKRVRRLKERLAMTEFRKQANRMNFGDIEDDAYQEDLGFSSGVIGKSGKGRIRAPVIDEKTKVRISKTLQKNLQKQQVLGGSTTIRKQVAGTASSIAFTPLQGLEIVNPQAAEVKVNEANAKYFSSTGRFVNVHKNDSKPM